MSQATDRAPLKLLVAVDGSAHTAAALQWIASLTRVGVKLTCLLTHVQRPILAGEVGVIAPVEAAAAARNQHTQLVLDQATHTVRSVGIPATPVTQTANDVPEALFACARQHTCDAIVVGRRGQGALRAALLGSVSASVVRHASLPVIVINREVAPLTSPPLRMVLATDGSQAADRATVAAARLAVLANGGEVYALHVRPDITLAETMLGPTDRLIEQWSNSNETQALDRAREIIESTGAVHAVFSTAAGDPNAVILREANELNASMIALGTRGLGPMSGLLAGSVARHVLQYARVPVLLSR